MTRAPFTIFLLVVLSVPSMWAVKITEFVDMDVYVQRGKQIVIADFITAENTHNYEDDLYTAEVNVVRVLKGSTTLGKLKVLTIYPITKGTRYLLYSLSDPPAFQAIPELSVIALPQKFDLARLDSNDLLNQLLLIFESRQAHIKSELESLSNEQRLLEKALSEK